MALTVTNCADFVKLTLAGEADAALPILTLVNMAGRHFCGMSRWNCLLRGPTTLTATVSQTYIQLPTDFGSVVSLVGVGSNVYYEFETLDVVLRLRSATSTNGSGPYVGAVVLDTPSTSTLPRAKVELYPTPGAADTFQLAYVAKWADLLLDGDYLPLPEWAETLFIRILQAHARGFMEEDQASLSVRLAELRDSPEFRAAAKQDRSLQSDLGEIRGSLSGFSRSRGWFGPDGRWPFSTITGP